MTGEMWLRDRTDFPSRLSEWFILPSSPSGCHGWVNVLANGIQEEGRLTLVQFSVCDSVWNLRIGTVRELDPENHWTWELEHEWSYLWKPALTWFSDIGTSQNLVHIITSWNSRDSERQPLTRASSYSCVSPSLGFLTSICLGIGNEIPSFLWPMPMDVSQNAVALGNNWEWEHHTEKEMVFNSFSVHSVSVSEHKDRSIERPSETLCLRPNQENVLMRE